MTKFKALIGISAAAVLIFGEVISAGREVRAAGFTVTNTNDSGIGSLRWAITEANANSVDDTISFIIPTTDPNYDSSNGWWVITPGSALPSLTDYGTTIYGYNTPPSLSGHDILIDGSNLGGTMSILTIESDYNRIQGLTFANAPGVGVVVP